jgi:hypothetical protein
MKNWLCPRGQMVHQQSKIFYRSGAGKLKRCQCWSIDYALFITVIFLVFLLHSCRISYSAGEPFVPEGIVSVSSLTSFYFSCSTPVEYLTLLVNHLSQMVHQQSKIFYRSGAGKLKICQWWNTDYALGDKWFTSRVRVVRDETMIIHSGKNRLPAEAGKPFVPEGIISVSSLTSF